MFILKGNESKCTKAIKKSCKFWHNDAFFF
nr:MAG TPA: hypothetical protein [Caudoviricetes sp.]